MMPCEYISKSGAIKKFDLDSVFDLVGGYSDHRAGWSALIIFLPDANVFVELRSSPQDYRGNSADEALEIDENYIKNTFCLTSNQIASFKEKPKSWKFIDHREGNHGKA